MALSNTPISGDDYRWKLVVEQKIKDLEKAVDKLVTRLGYIEGRLKK